MREKGQHLALHDELFALSRPAHGIKIRHVRGETIGVANRGTHRRFSFPNCLARTIASILSPHPVARKMIIIQRPLKFFAKLSVAKQVGVQSAKILTLTFVRNSYHL